MVGRYAACIDWTSTDQLHDLIPKSLLELGSLPQRPRLKCGRRCAHDAVFGRRRHAQQQTHFIRTTNDIFRWGMIISQLKRPGSAA